MNIIAKYDNGNHRVVLLSDGTRVRSTFDLAADHFTYDFPENADIKITDYCGMGCKFCHENSTVHGKHGDLKSMETLISSLHAGTELAIGGGDAFSHPDLRWFLERLKAQGVIANITINQGQLRQHRELLDSLRADNLLHGIGISLSDPDDTEIFEYIDTLGDNTVIHTIAGLLSERDVHALVRRKILILGYKNLRRGETLFNKEKDVILNNIAWLRYYLPVLGDKCKSISFDCLGIEQLEPMRTLHICADTYNRRFQGSDTDVMDDDGNITCATMYIDVPNMQVARMSTAPFDMCIPFGKDETIAELFNKSIIGWKEAKHD